MTKETDAKTNAWDLWSKEFQAAKKFFKSNGNGKTRARLKKRWCDEFMNSLCEVQRVTKDAAVKEDKELLQNLLDFVEGIRELRCSDMKSDGELPFGSVDYYTMDDLTNAIEKALRGKE